MYTGCLVSRHYLKEKSNDELIWVKSMSIKTRKLETDVVIAGGGPGGCTIAKELSKKGKRVILIEKGGSSNLFLGHPLGVLLRLEKAARFPLPVRSTTEGDTVILAQCLGGGTVIYAGAAFKPDISYWKRYGIDMPEELIGEAMEECWVSLTPDEFIGPGARRVWEAATDLGIPFEKQYRHIDFSRCQAGSDGCINGCRLGAKWTARVFADQAIENGATLLTYTRVQDIMTEEGAACGVRAVDPYGRRYEIRAKAVICSAGGTHTAGILQRSGIPQAGSWFTGDPTFFTFGFVKNGPGNTNEHNMTVGWHDEENGIIYCSMASPFLSWQMQFLQDEQLRGLIRTHRYRQVLSVFSKVTDDGVGKITPNGKISKTFTKRDQLRFAHSRQINEKILLKAGCDANDLHHSGFIMGHPSGTVRVGQLLDTDLQTSIENLYCCDTSVFPEAPGRPPALTVVVLGKMLARRLESIL